RMLGFLDSPDTPFIDLPIAGALDETITAFVSALRDRRDWDIFSLQRIPAHSKTWRALEAALAAEFPCRPAGRERIPFLPIAADWKGSSRPRPQRSGKTCRNIENRLRRSGVVTVEEHRHVDPEGALFAEVMEVSRQSWKGPRGLAMATMEGMPRFFQ